MKQARQIISFIQDDDIMENIGHLIQYDQTGVM